MGLKSQFCELVQKLFKLILKLKTYISVSKLRKFIAILLFCESIFYFRHKHLEHYVNNIPVSIVQPPFNKKKIVSMSKYSQMYMEYFDGSYREWLAKRFNCSFHQIKKENLRHFITWAYFLQYDKAIKSKLDSKEIEWRDNFISSHLKYIESRLKYKFEEGNNANIQMVASTTQKQKIPIIYHPFTMYLGIAISKQIANSIFLYHFTFTYKYIKGLKVWFRFNKTLKTMDNIQPMLLFGGVSAANPMQWTVFIRSLIEKYQYDKNLFIIEIPWSEMMINHFIPYSKCGYLNYKLPLRMHEITDIVFDLENMILNHNKIAVDGWNNSNKTVRLQWNLVGQSFGTFMCSAIYQRIKEYSLGIIPRLILIGAPTLCMSDPAANRLQGIVEVDFEKLLFQVFIGKEIMIATMGARYFHWMEYCLYPHQLINDKCNKPHIVISGTLDHVIPYKTIEKGICEANKLCEDDGKQIIHITMDDTNHGGFMIHTGYQKHVIHLL